MGILTMIVIGLVAGLIARAIVPGRQSMGVLATILLGIVGSFVGGLLGSLFSSDGNLMDLRPSGLLWSIIGSVVVLLLIALAGRRRSCRRSPAAWWRARPSTGGPERWPGR